MKQPISNSQPRSFEYSLDWRFFLPITAESNILYIGEKGDEVKAFFERVGVNSFHSFFNTSQLKKHNAETTFDIVVLPYGLAQNSQASTETLSDIQIYQALRKITHHNGQVYIGFSRKKDFISLLKVKSLLRKSGFKLIKSYALLSDPYTPEYIFQLSAREIGFALRHRYRYRFPAWLLKLVTSPLASLMLSNFFPAYFIIAQRID